MRPLASVLLVLSMSTACSDTSPIEPLPVEEGAAPVADVVSQHTTDGPAALGNLSTQLEALEELLAIRPNDMLLVSQAVGLYLARTQYIGSYQDFTRVDELTSSALSVHANSTDALLARADYLSAIHEFADAHTHLDRAEALGAGKQDDRRAKYWLATGQRLDEVLALRIGAFERAPTYNTITSLAAVRAARGEFEEADELYVRALREYRDVSPFPVAWISFQRGVMWAEMAGRPDWARPLYEEAVARLPGYIVANVHLAEIEHADGHLELAIARLMRVLSSTSDPEPASRLALWLSGGRASSYRMQALSGYEALLRRYEPAFSDHAAEFFAGAGDDLPRARKLALRNLDNRKTARAYLLALNVALAAKDRALLCQLAEGARTVSGNVKLDELLAEHAPSCRS